MPRRIGGKDPNLTILHLAQRPTILPRAPHRVLALFHKARLIEHQDTIWITHLVGHELMGVPHHLLLIPPHITDEPLHPSDGAPLNLEGHRLNRFTFKLAELAHHIVKEMGARLTAGETVVKGRLESPQVLHELFYIAG